MIKPNSDCSIRHPGPAPLEFAGEWVAWNKSLTEVVAHSKSFKEAYSTAVAAGHADAVFEKVRRPGFFIGPR